MKALGIIGFLFLLVIIPLAQFSVSNFAQYTELQREADEEAIECANTICFGLGLTALEAREHFENSMYYLMTTLLIAPTGAIFMALNWRDLIDK